MLGGGAVVVGVGLLIGNGKKSGFDDAATGGIVGIIGGVSATCSIPLFIASSRNNRKAGTVTTSFFFQQNKVFTPAGFALRPTPTPAIRLSL